MYFLRKRFSALTGKQRKRFDKLTLGDNQGEFSTKYKIYEQNQDPFLILLFENVPEKDSFDFVAWAAYFDKRSFRYLHSFCLKSKRKNGYAKACVENLFQNWDFKYKSFRLFSYNKSSNLYCKNIMRLAKSYGLRSEDIGSYQQ